MTTKALLAKTNTEPVPTYSQSFCASTPWTIQSEAVNNSNETITIHTSENQQTNENLANSNKPPLITRRQLIILLIINFSVLSEASCYSILAPFFPEMAEKKHLTSTQYGFVFGIFHLVLLVSSPIVPKLISFVNAKFLVNAGIFFAGGCSILFGILNLSPPGATFLTLSLVIRILEAFGTSAMFIISYTIIGREFNERRATALATIEMSFGLGITIGPSVGGVLYQVGGYMLPFFVLGGILLLLALIMLLFLPNTDCTTQGTGSNFLKIILNFTFLVNMMNVLTGLLFMGFNEATLEPHIRKFYLQPSIVGLFFLVSGGCYAIGTLCWGHMSDKVPHSRVPLLVSSFICVLALLFIGPVPFIPLDTSIWLVILCQVFIGIGSAGKLVAGYNSSLTNAISRGFPNDATTMAVITGVFSAVLAIGGFVGPSLGGVLLDNIGYENGTCVLLGLEMTILFLNVAHIFWYNLCRRRDVSDDMVPIVAAD